MELDLKYKIAAFAIGAAFAAYKLFQLRKSGDLDTEKRIADHEKVVADKGEGGHVTFKPKMTLSNKLIALYFTIAIIAAFGLMFLS